MNVLLYSHVPLWEVHYAETIELALRHYHLKDKVVLFSCTGELTSCPANATHKLDICDVCADQTQYSNKGILKGKIIDIRVAPVNEKLILPEFLSIDDVLNYTYDDFPIGELAISQLVNETRDSYMDIAIVKDRLALLIGSGVALYEQTRREIKNQKINRVYAWNGRRCSDGPVLYAAKKEGVEYYSHISVGPKTSFLLKNQIKVQSLVENKNDILRAVNSELLKGNLNRVESEAKIFFENQRYGTLKYNGSIHFGKNFDPCKDMPLKIKGAPIAIFTSRRLLQNSPFEVN